MEQSLAAIERLEEAVVPIASVVGQVAYIQEVQRAVMRDGEHYGVIPGVQKPSLWKAGAEKLCTSFRLDPQYDTVHRIEQESFILIEVKCILYHIPTGKRIASGEGSANSREEKWMYRNVATDEPVPSAYWDARKKGDGAKMKEIIGDDGQPKKKGGSWVIARRVVNPNPYDLHNTIVKMACKRALVAAVLNATAASDIFTQDVEDLPHFDQPEVVEVAPAPAPQPAPPPDNVDTDTGEIVEAEYEPVVEDDKTPDGLRKKTWAMLMEMADGNRIAATHALEGYTAFTNAKGEVVGARSDINKVSDKAIKVTHSKVKKAFEAGEKILPEGDGDEELVEGEMPF